MSHQQQFDFQYGQAIPQQQQATAYPQMQQPQNVGAGYMPVQQPMQQQPMQQQQMMAPPQQQPQMGENAALLNPQPVSVGIQGDGSFQAAYGSMNDSAKFEHQQRMQQANQGKIRVYVKLPYQFRFFFGPSKKEGVWGVLDKVNVNFNSEGQVGVGIRDETYKEKMWEEGYAEFLVRPNMRVEAFRAQVKQEAHADCCTDFTFLYEGENLKDNGGATLAEMGIVDGAQVNAESTILCACCPCC